MTAPVLPKLRDAARFGTRYELVTPCCQLTPELRDGVLRCPCGAGYQKLAELVRAKGAA